MTVCICCKCIDKTKKKQIMKREYRCVNSFLHKTFCNDIPNVTLLKIMYARIREKVKGWEPEGGGNQILPLTYPHPPSFVML